jgi:hypothetical protein
MRLAVVLGASLILGTLIGSSALLLERTGQTALHSVDTKLQNTALIVENTINRQLLQVDGALASLPALFVAVTSQVGEIDQQSGTRLLGSFNFATFAFRDLLLIRPDGTLWAAARPRPRSQPPPRIAPPDERRTPAPSRSRVRCTTRLPETGAGFLHVRSRCPGSETCKRLPRYRWRSSRPCFPPSPRFRDCVCPDIRRSDHPRNHKLYRVKSDSCPVFRYNASPGPASPLPPNLAMHGGTGYAAI